MGAIHFSVDIHLVAALRKSLPLSVFFETGTFHGDTACAAASLFEKVYTVELSAELFAQAAARLATYQNISALLGSSPSVIRKLRPDLANQSVLFWLDAHWCGAAHTGGKAYECPLLEELAAIGSLNDESVVLIDDARMFLTPPPLPHDSRSWPLLNEVAEALRRLSSRHKLWIINDVFIFAPQEAYDPVVDYGLSRGVDLHHLALKAALADSPPPVVAPPGPPAGLPIGASFNAEFLRLEASSRIFAHHLQRLGISRVMDVGSNTGQFACKLRRYGFGGIIYSVEPQASAYTQLLAHAHQDLHWFPLARQAAGAQRQFGELNLSENSWSSSLLEVHVNHMRAEISTRTVAQERIFVNVSGQLLRPELMSQIEALKIDVQGYEDRVLEGYLPYLQNVRLLLVEMSVVECYKDSVDLFSLDERLVKQHGFARVSLEPAYYDDALGVVQQYDGIYYRSDRPATTAGSSQGVRIGAILSSFGPIPEQTVPEETNLNARWLNDCWKSWQSLCPCVISVSESPPLREGVQWVKTESKPMISEMVAASHPLETDQHLLLTNADILFTSRLIELLPQLDPESIYYGHRLDVEQEPDGSGKLREMGAYQFGFDYFLLPADFLRIIQTERLLPVDFRIGDPWWDYLLPILALSLGFPLKKLPSTPPIALHHVHSQRYANELWLGNGKKFIEFIERLMHEPRCNAITLLSEMASQHGNLEQRLHQISHLACHGLP